MKFYDRKQEIEVLEKRLTSPKFELIYLLGRRRIGKTELIQHLNTEILHADFLYLFVEKSDLSTFLNRQERNFYRQFGVKYRFETIEDFLETFFNQTSVNILVIDEFQNFEAIDKSIFSTFQKIVDKYHKSSTKKIVVLGSIQSMMIKIFENAKEPLYKRATQPMIIKAFDLDTQIKILQDTFGNNYSHKIVVDSYTLFGGVPYYLKSLRDLGYTHYDFNQLLKDLFFSDFAPLQNEGKEILIEEFGQKYRRFFAILEAIARGKNRHHEIVSELGIGEKGEVNVYLRDLVQTYEMIEVVFPILEIRATTTRYKIKDNFLNFRFRYIYANKELFELGSYEELLQETMKDFSSFQGFAFEKLVKDWIILQNKKGELDFSIRKIGTRLDRKNNEIDLVYTDEKEHIVFLECKLNEKRINQAEKNQLMSNVSLFLDKHPYFKDKKIKIGFAIFDEKELIKFDWIE